MTRKTYLEELAQELSILPSEERQDIILEFDSHIDELMSRQPELPEEELIARLPAPATFASEFLAAAVPGKEQQTGTFSSGRRASESGHRFSNFRRFFRYARGEEQQLDWDFNDVQRIELVGVSADIEIRQSELCACHIEGYWDEEEPTWEQSGSLLRLDLGPDADKVLLSIPESLSDLIIRTASGDIRGELVPEANISINGASSDVQLTLARGNAEIATASGDVSLSGALQNASIKTASGDIHIQGMHASVRLASASGDISVSYANAEADGSISSMSGDVMLQLTPDSHPAIEASTVSGDISVPDASVCKQPGRKRCRCDGGPGQLTIKTMSGDIAIRK